jgi:hypothetical protein
MHLLVFILFSVFMAGCATLNPDGANVRIKKEAPDNCDELGDISVGNLASLASQSDVKNALRNEAAKLGGNLLVLDAINAVPMGGYSGSGQAFDCPE